MKKNRFIWAFVVLFFLAGAAESFACSCVVSRKPLKTQIREAFNDAAAVFAGEVVEIVSKNEYEVTVRIRVESSWKGAPPAEITLTTGQNSALCGYKFETGRKYLVYAYGPRGSLATNNCSRTSAAAAPAEIRYLDKLRKSKNKKS